MLKRLNLKFLSILIALFLNGSLFAQEQQEVVVTIEEENSLDIDNPDFIKGEELREQYKFQDAITEYQKVVDNDAETDEVKAEADYRIGICYTWMGKVNDADSHFKVVLNRYPNNVKKVAASQYCLAWVEIQGKQFYQAIDRLQKTLDDGICTDEEICSKTQFQIGRIYLAFLHDYDKAREAFKKVVENYPDAKINNHPFIKDFKGEEIILN